MKSVAQIIKRFRRGPADIVALDVRDFGICAVRIRKGAARSVLVAADILDPLPAQTEESTEEQAAGTPVLHDTLSLPPALKAKHAALLYSGNDAIIKLLSVPGHFDESAEQKLMQSLGVSDDGNYRIGYEVVLHGQGKVESRAVGAAIPELQATQLLSLVASGHPVPYSIEAAELAAMTAFLQGPAAANKEECFGLLSFGDDSSCFAIFDHNIPALIRTFSIGMNSLTQQVQRALGVDAKIAEGILCDGSFDVSHSIDGVVDPLVKQLLLSRDFVERRENCRLKAIYASGVLLTAKTVLDGIASSMGTELRAWNPFEALIVEEGALPDHLVGQEWKFAPAVGACLGAFNAT